MILTRRNMILATGAAATLVGCGEPGPRFLTYDGPPVTAVIAWKARRQLVLMNDSEVLRQYHIELGFAPTGHKQFEGDGRTPEGAYRIDRKNPRSSFHLSVGVSYPNQQDREFALSQGRRPGGDIFVHGTPRARTNQPDWTAGCIAVENSEIEEIYAMVPVGTPIVILP